MSIVLSKVFQLLYKPNGPFSHYDSSFICLLSLDKMSTNTVEVNSFIKGYYEYQADWEPTLEDI